MKVREYARHRGISHVAVLAAIKDGRLSRSVTLDKKGKPIIDAELADEEWEPSYKELLKEQSVKRRVVDDETGSADAPGAYAKARSIRENFQAKLAQLEYEKEAEKLVDAELVKTEWTKIASTVRTKILGIPAKAKQRIPELNHESYFVLEAIVREALEELSDGGD